MRYLHAVISSALHKLSPKQLQAYLKMEQCEVLPSKQILVTQLKNKITQQPELLESLYYNHLDIFSLSSLDVCNLFSISEHTCGAWTHKGRLILTLVKLPTIQYYGHIDNPNVIQPETLNQARYYYDAKHIEQLLQEPDIVQQWKDDDKEELASQKAITKSILEKNQTQVLSANKLFFLNLLKIWSHSSDGTKELKTLVFWASWLNKLLTQYQVRILTATTGVRGDYQEKLDLFTRYKKMALDILVESPYTKVYFQEAKSKLDFSKIVYCLNHYTQWSQSNQSKEMFYFEHEKSILDCPLCATPEKKAKQGMYHFIVNIPDRTLPYTAIFHLPVTQEHDILFPFQSKLPPQYTQKEEGIYDEENKRVDMEKVVFSEHAIVKGYLQTMAKYYPTRYIELFQVNHLHI